MVSKGERLELRLDTDAIEQIDKWRSGQPGLPSRSEAVRRLVEIGVSKTPDEQLFQLARFQLLATVKSPGMESTLPKAYIYAWQRGIYPALHDGYKIHKPFSSQFAVSEEILDELLKFFDDRWKSKDIPSFYQLEDYYGHRSVRPSWNRGDLIGACRYMYLDDCFDKEFWNALLIGSDHPTESKSIIRKFDIAEDVEIS